MLLTPNSEFGPLWACDSDFFEINISLSLSQRRIQTLLFVGSSRRNTMRIQPDKLLDFFDAIGSDLSDMEVSEDDDEEYLSETNGTKLTPLKTLDPYEVSSDSSDPDDMPLISQAGPKTVTQQRVIWKRKRFIPIIPAWSDTATAANEQLSTPFQYFCKYIDSDFFDLAAIETNRYSIQQNVNNPIVTNPTEMRKFVGIHLVMGCMKFPRYRWYWSPATRVSLIADAMGLNRFMRLRACFHLVDNETAKDPNNRLWKVQPVIDRVLARCQQLLSHENVSIDEQMCPFTGQLEIKQYIRGKPCPWGIKLYLLCNSDGLVLNFDVYQGKTTIIPEEYKALGVGGGIVMKLMTGRKIPKGTKLYTDNFFTSIPLLQALRQEGWYGTGTVRANRMARCPVKPEKEMKKEGRGAMEEIVLGADELVIVRWLDNNIVSMASNLVGIGEIGHARRWSKAESRYIQVPQPEVIRRYNTSMGGVDKVDHLMSLYRTFIRSRKWPLRLIFHMIDLAVTNSWMEYIRDCQSLSLGRRDKLDLVAFRKEVACALIQAHTSTLRSVGRPRESNVETEEQTTVGRKRKISCKPVSDVRYDGYHHWPVNTGDKHAQRCKMDGCKLKTTTRCQKCNVELCFRGERNCFKDFHVK